MGMVSSPALPASPLTDPICLSSHHLHPERCRAADEGQEELQFDDEGGKDVSQKHRLGSENQMRPPDLPRDKPPNPVARKDRNPIDGLQTQVLISQGLDPSPSSATPELCVQYSHSLSFSLFRKWR